MQTTSFRIWFVDSRVQPVWTGVKLVRAREYFAAAAMDVMVEGDGTDLKRLIARRRDIFAAYLQLKAQDDEEQ